MANIADSAIFGEQFLDDIIDWIADNLEPDDVFSPEELYSWAEDNGYRAENYPN